MKPKTRPTNRPNRELAVVIRFKFPGFNVDVLFC